ncbi:hypothetical protein ISN45_At04g021130 [Arabidopsis thaliana x Arabidopsis arenosa]|uniref:Uncharacterized protein n=2 Tax=Arabidopsis TaxID=3701 RepID=A0A8T2EG04_ARASU|nr:hypothetical protein ISN45_At04g021130 [Arabidopsis thaliana x Arabidopsis arenosa]KAG7621144.1 hypothetical protein ISN44_As04g020650 [Arabidopsis suecica]
MRHGQLVDQVRQLLRINRYLPPYKIKVIDVMNVYGDVVRL